MCDLKDKLFHYFQHESSKRIAKYVLERYNIKSFAAK